MTLEELEDYEPAAGDLWVVVRNRGPSPTPTSVQQTYILHISAVVNGTVRFNEVGDQRFDVERFRRYLSSFAKVELKARGVPDLVASRKGRRVKHPDFGPGTVLWDMEDSLLIRFRHPFGVKTVREAYVVILPR